MKSTRNSALAAGLAVWLAVLPAWPAEAPGDTRTPSPQQEIAILQIRVVEGEGAVVGAGNRSSRGIITQVTDETGKPVEGAAVSFYLPAEGPSGVFASGLKTEIAVSGADGKASVYGITWNPTPGPVQIRVTAVKGEARAGTVVAQYVSEHGAAVASKGTKNSVQGRGSKTKWILLGLLVAGAGGGAALGLSQSKSSGGSGAPPAGVATPPAVGTPTFTIGRP